MGPDVYDIGDNGAVLWVTSIGPATKWMPTIESYMALAEAMHSEDEMCNASMFVPFAECVTHEYDIEHAVKVIVQLHKDGWRLVPDPGPTVEMGL